MLRTFLPLIAAILAVAASPVAADPIVGGAEHCVVNVRADDRLNLRTEPGTSYSVLGQLAHTRCGVTVTGPCRGSWCPVEDGHYAGWVHRHYIAAIPEVEFCFTAAAPHESRAVRRWPSFASAIQVEFPADHCGITPLPHATDAWQKVRSDGWEGWLPKAALAHTGD